MTLLKRMIMTFKLNMKLFFLRRHLSLLMGGPCVDAGLSSFKLDDSKEILLDRKYISGHKPDIGALESGSADKSLMMR